MSARRLNRRHRAYERSRGIDARGLYGYTARTVRCDRCLRDYLPQHTEKVGRWSWWCGNCVRERHSGAQATPRPELRYRYADDKRTLAAFGLITP